MESVGIRELKNHLTHYLRAVRRGNAITVTVHGKPIARLVPISPQGETALTPEVEKRMWELAADGFLAWDGGGFQVPEAVVGNQGAGLLSDLVVEDRE
jgi:prevent-host-death family protein